MHCLSIFLAAVLFAGAGSSAFAVKRKSHYHARPIYTHKRSHHHTRSRRTALEAKEEPARTTIPEESLQRVKLTPVPPLKGSRESLIRQNQRSEAEGLERI